MSVISELGKGYKNLPTILMEYEEPLINAKEQLKIRGKKLEVSISENSSWLHYYDERRIELHSLVKFFKAEEDRIRGGLFKSYKEKYSRALTQHEISKYIDHEEAYGNIHALLIEVEEIYEPEVLRYLFVGTKPEAKGIVRSTAELIDMPYVTERWLGGTLTNKKELNNRLVFI